MPGEARPASRKFSCRGGSSRFSYAGSSKLCPAVFVLSLFKWIRKQVSEKRDLEMGRPEKDGRCKKHPSHKNSNGVCPYCLRDRLANLSGSSSSSRNNAGSSTSSATSTAYSSYDSDVSSSAESPPRREERNRKRLFQLLRGGRKRTLKSSLSFSLSKEVERENDEKGKEEKRKSKKGAGKLWAKLTMGGVGRKKQGEGRSSTLSHSKTVKEKPSSKWTFFS